MYKKTLIFFSALCVFAYVAVFSHKENIQMAQMIACTQQDKNEFHQAFMQLCPSKEQRSVEYKFLDTFIKILDTHDIPYMAAYGTLLGAVRHKGFIPWDDDMDLIIEEEYEEKFLSLESEFLKNGIIIKPKHTSVFVKEKNQGWYGASLQDPHKTNIYIDVFFGRRMSRQEINDVPRRNIIIQFFGKLKNFFGLNPQYNGPKEFLHLKSLSARYMFPGEYMNIDDIYPLKEYDFGPINIKGMNTYDRFFKQCGYRLDCAKIYGHGPQFEIFEAKKAHFEQKGLYPVTDPFYVSFKCNF